jgi:MFS family permease
VAPSAGGAPRGSTQIALLSVTVLGTMCNNVVNVPLRSIAADFDQPLSAAVLCVGAFALTLAVTMPFTGWLGDRWGQTRVLTWSVALMMVAQALAAMAPTLPILIALRALQGLACSAIPPMVMGLLGALYPQRRLEVMGAWAAANGVGQAIGPPVGGVVDDLLGWRAIFVLLTVACLAVLLALRWLVPDLPPQPAPLDVRGAALLTGGVALVLVAVTVFSQRDAAAPILTGGLLAGLIMLLGYAVSARGRQSALIPLPVLVEIRFVRSMAAGFGQMFCLGAALVALPLLFTGPLGMSSALAGVLFFTLPVVMAVGAPVVSRTSRKHGARLVLRAGLGSLVVTTLLTGVVARLAPSAWVAAALVALMVVLGFGMAMVQTPAAAGATSSTAGRYGAAVGLFNMVRFSGSATAAAWVAWVYPTGHLLLLFAGCSVVVALGTAIAWVGADPEQAPRLPISRTSGRG